MLIFSHGYEIYYVHETAMALYTLVIKYIFFRSSVYLEIPSAYSTTLKEEISQKTL